MADAATHGDVENNLVPSIDRRGLMKRAALTAAGATMAGAASPALAAIDAGLRPNRRLSTFDGAYALPGGAIVRGYFASPRGATRLDVVVLMPGTDGVTSALKRAAQRQALGGAIVIVPDLHASASLPARMAGHDAMVSHIVALSPGLRRMTHGNGTVRFLAAA